MKRKLQARRGASLVETLVAIIVLTILTSGGITAAAAAMTNYLHMSEAANAEVLASTVIETIANEVRQGGNISVSGLAGADPAGPGSSLTLDSQRWGLGAELKLDGDGHLVAESTSAAGTAPMQLISENTYAGLKLAALSFTEVDKGTVTAASAPGSGDTAFTIGFTVQSETSGELWQGSATVAPMQW